jgi:cytoskeleton protein RodZ
MTSIGETLRRERIKRKLDLHGVSGELKISPRMLEAIEAEDFDKLPGGVFARSFVRQYARLLGLDEDEISTELQRILEPQSGNALQALGKQPDIPLPRVDAWEAVGDKSSSGSKLLPPLAMVVVTMLVCSGVYSWWQRSHRPGASRQTTAAPAETATAPAPTALQTANPAPPSEPSAAADRKNETGGEADTARNNPQTPPTAQTQPSSGGASSPASTTASSSAAAASPTSQAAVRVEMTADEPVWVSARGDGKYLFSATLQPNESRTAEAAGTVTLRLGNAGGIRISVNGKPIGPVGPKGQIRTVQLTPGGFQILSPDAPKPASTDPLDPL